MRALVLLMLFATAARGERALCGHGYHGAAIDLDVKDADIHDVLRLLADTGHVNLVVSDEVTGTVTLALHRVPWDQVACVIAATKKLSITVDGNILLVTTAARSAAPHRRTTATPS